MLQLTLSISFEKLCYHRIFFLMAPPEVSSSSYNFINVCKIPSKVITHKDNVGKIRKCHLGLLLNDVIIKVYDILEKTDFFPEVK